jgi:dTMP kinase
MVGAFITFEGIEGCGKSTQIRMLAEALEKSGVDLVLTREPGGTVIGERIRSVVLDSAHEEMAPITELLLYAAARHQHLQEVILPSLQKGRIVLCDRYADATAAYQGAARRIGADLLAKIHTIATGDLWPHLTVLLDCPAELGLARAKHRNAADASQAHLDRFEREALAFHERVREGYLAIAAAEPTRFAVIDATKGIEEMHGEILATVEAFLRKRPVS